MTTTAPPAAVITTSDVDVVSPPKVDLEALKDALDLLVHKTLEGADAVKKQKTGHKMRSIGGWNNAGTGSRATSSHVTSVSSVRVSGAEEEQAFFSQRPQDVLYPSFPIPTGTVAQTQHLRHSQRSRSSVSLSSSSGYFYRPSSSSSSFSIVSLDDSGDDDESSSGGGSA